MVYNNGITANMIATIVLIALFTTVHSSTGLPKGCSSDVERLNPKRDSIHCEGANFFEVIEYCASQNKNFSVLAIENCNPPIPRLKKLPALSVKFIRFIGCKIEEIADDAFVNVPHIREINLTNNSITKFPNMQLMPQRLRYLVLDHNKISSIEDGAFQQLNTLGRYYERGYIGLSYVKNTYLDKLSLQHNELTELTDSMFAGLSVEKMLLNDNRISYISPNAFKDFTVNQLFLRNNNIMKLAPGTFDSLKDLAGLYLENNQLREVPTFSSLKNLKHLYLDDNQLQHLPEGVFKDMNSLMFVYLRNNQLKHLLANTFDNLKKLGDVDLSNNQLETLDANVFSRYMPGLTSLSLQNNRLTTLPKSFFSNLGSLWSLDLSNNNLTSLPQNSFYGTKLGLSKTELDDENLFFFLDINLLGNPLVCDDKLAWLIELMKCDYVKPPYDENQPKCVAPPTFAGKNLKDVPIDQLRTKFVSKTSKPSADSLFV